MNLVCTLPDVTWVLPDYVRGETECDRTGHYIEEQPFDHRTGMHTYKCTNEDCPTPWRVWDERDLMAGGIGRWARRH